MGQEIFYCCKCQCQSRTADFVQGGALKLGERACCVKCGPALLATLPPQEQEKFFKEAAKLKASPPDPVTSRPRIPVTPPAQAVVLPAPHRKRRLHPVLWGAIGAFLPIIVVGIAFFAGTQAAPPTPKSEDLVPALKTPLS